MHPEPFNPNSRLRASDADREQAASVLSAALAEGRLSVAEHSDRLDAVYEAKTHAEIAPLIDDLPAKGIAPSVTPRADLVPGSRRRQLVIAIFGGAVRRGRWAAEPRMHVLTVFGGSSLDFREAQLPQPEITVNCMTVFGGVDIVVPPQMRVIDSGIALFGERDTGPGSEESADPNAPVLRLTGLTVFGALSVKHKQRKAKNKGITS